MNRDSKHVLTELLVYSAQSGRETAFKELYALWHADLRRFCVSRIGNADPADEILSEAWLSIARGLGRLEDPACFPRWAFRIVENRCADWIRARARARRREVAAASEAERLAPAAAGPVDPPEQVLQLREAIATLPEAQRQLLHLYYHAGRSVAEIADVLDLAAGTVKSRLFSLRESLKRILENKSS
jgi:RNA polymerase sigma-70 factor (ECF subfamily)